MEKNELNKNDILMNGAVDTDYNLLMSAMQVSVSTVSYTHLRAHET